jgi:hypothetical protein
MEQVHSYAALRSNLLREDQSSEANEKNKKIPLKNSPAPPPPIAMCGITGATAIAFRNSYKRTIFHIQAHIMAIEFIKNGIISSHHHWQRRP